MSRLRMTFITAAMLLALAALTLNSLAQPPGRGGGGFGGGRRGGFGGPGGGFGGPGGWSLLQLASNPAVQEDLKVTEKQKAQIKSLSDKYEEKMQALRVQGGFGPGGPGQGGGPQGKGQRRGRNGNGQNGQGGGGGDGFRSVQPQDPNAPGGGQGQDPNAPGGGGGGGRGNRGNRGNGNAQGVQDDPQAAEQRNQQRQMAREAMTELRQAAESSLAKILDKGQVVRLKQIQLQFQGPRALLQREDIIEKLNIEDDQIAMMRELADENRNVQRQTMRSRFEMLQTASARINPNQGNNGQNAGANGAAENGDNNANANNGRNRGGRGGRGNFDPEVMRKVMEDPQVKAQMEEFQTQDQKLTAQLATAISKVLSARQRTNYKKLLGAPFDQSKLGVGSPWGGRGGAGPGNNQATAKVAASSSDVDDDDDAPKAKPSTPATRAKSKPAVAKKKSLRELRGERSGDDN